MRCLLCGASGGFRPRYVKSGYHIQTCTACGLTQLAPPPSRETLERLYGDAYFERGAGESVGYDDYAAQEAEYVATFADDIRRIRQFVPDGRVLDVGCGYGYFLRAALEAGYDAYGMDVAEHAVRVAEARFPGRVLLGTVESVTAVAPTRFSVIFASHLIEHLLDPGRFVAALAERLRPGGVLVLVTPNIKSLLARLSGARWVSFKVPEHVAYYDPLTIGRLLDGNGLETVAVDSAYQHYRVPFVMKRLRELFHPVARLVPRVENLPLLRDRIIRVTSGSLRVIARKPSGA